MKKILFAAFIALLLAGCATTSVSTESIGEVSQIPLVAKDFEIVGLITLKSTASFNHGGIMTSGSKITFEMLYNAVHELGADDFVNLRIDELRKTIEVPVPAQGQGQGQGQQSTRRDIVEYTAFAFAIKYK